MMEPIQDDMSHYIRTYISVHNLWLLIKEAVEGPSGRKNWSYIKNPKHLHVLVSALGIDKRWICAAERGNVVRQWAILPLTFDTNHINKLSSRGQSNVTT